MVAVFVEVWRVLKDDGSLWLNMGDSYAHDTKGDTRTKEDYIRQGATVGALLSGAQNVGGKRKCHHGLKPKDLCGMPWRLAFALQADGWCLRQDIIWHKPNPMPESVTDRCTKAHEYIFLMTKKPRYYYDADAIREPHKDPERGRIKTHESSNPHNAPKESMAIRWTPETRQYNPAVLLFTSLVPDISFSTILTLALPHFLQTHSGQPARIQGSIRSGGNVAKWASL